MTHVKKVVVTGSNGKIGREAVDALRAVGHRVVGFDVIRDPNASTRTVIVDCNDFGQVLGALSGTDFVGGPPDAVVHLAGIPAPGQAPDHTTFQTNAISTYHVLSACVKLKIPRVVWGSSETLLGLPFDVPPAFLPLDETAPVRPESDYAMSKELGEAMADTFVRWCSGLTVASLRFSNVFGPADRGTLDKVQRDPAVRRLNLWGYVDARDAGRACQLAVDADLNGHERFIIAAADTIVDVPSAQLASDHWAGVEVRGELKGNASLLRSERAACLLDYRPRFSWRDW